MASTRSTAKSKGRSAAPKRSTAKPKGSSAVRPKDRPTRRTPPARRSSGEPRAVTTRRVLGGKSPLNPGFPRWAVWSALALVVAVVAGWLLLASSMFGVRDVQVSGSALVSEQEVREAIGLGPDDALLTADTDAAAERVQQLAPVAEATVSRSLPSTLVVRITERSPVATVELDGESWVIDVEGVPYAEASAVGESAEGLLPLVIDDPSPDDHATREAVAVIAGLDDATRELVASVSAPSAAQVTLTLQDGREVIWGDSSQMNDKLTMLPGVLTHSGSVFDISSPGAIVIS
ncbi:cell division protein FtsQ/DivIB [Blastococcus sp. Marseille-P5729]|uniref:cell division protein FtsQ/DivIB n=1 Tax=Blastococcus sp. Marseille-P5729 TaxID=2086582 RepID=UPI000D109F83|nr:FtsQ-type POTRA domain-containing protein [Blastococcus sp. Marseille-P5729]